MDNFFVKLRSELKTLIQKQEQDAKQRAQWQVNSYIKTERFKLSDLKSKKTFYKKSLKEVNKEINALDIAYEAFHSIDEDTGEVKNLGLLFSWSAKKANKVFEKNPSLSKNLSLPRDVDYDIFISHFMIEFEPVNILMFKLRERQFILNKLKQLHGTDSQPLTTISKTEIAINFIIHERPKYKGHLKAEFYRKVLDAIKAKDYHKTQIPSIKTIEAQFNLIKKDIEPIIKPPTNRKK